MERRASLPFPKRSIGVGRGIGDVREHRRLSNLADSSPGCRVLVVDDEPKTRAAIAEALALEGWSVGQAARGREMVALLDEQAYDLVILDWMLPGRCGLELLHEIRSRGAQVPVLMLTARSEVDDRVIGLESGADDYLTKPFSMAELLAQSRVRHRLQ